MLRPLADTAAAAVVVSWPEPRASRETLRAALAFEEADPRRSDPRSARADASTGAIALREAADRDLPDVAGPA